MQKQRFKYTFSIFQTNKNYNYTLKINIITVYSTQLYTYYIQ